MDAITLSMAGYAGQGGEASTAVVAILIAALANTFAKFGIVVALGSEALRWRLLPVTVALLITGAVAIALV